MMPFPSCASTWRVNLPAPKARPAGGESARQLKIKKHRRDSRRWRGDVANELILGKRRGAEAGEDLPVQLGGFPQGSRRAWRDRLRRSLRYGGHFLRLGVQGLDHIGGRSHQNRAIADQMVATARAGIKGMPRHGQNLAANRQRRFGCDQAVPDLAAASITTIAGAKPAIRRLRVGKCRACG